ncbi:MAG TPA: BTAD domain-containing putative transcriptional regulator [Streptosporangiaceae bacterium]|nr:BTAD domain-containing putative transcriptional regulator [Streptosporangiaceae bacterium]
MAGGIAFGLLGPLSMSVGDRVLPTLPAKERVVLAALLLKPGRTVPLEELIEAAWGLEAPRSALGTLRDYVKELRKRIALAGEQRITTVPGGYLIRVGPGELDIASFQESHMRATEAAVQGAWEQAAEHCRAAELLWRGEPLADIPSELLTAREVPRLAEMRLQSLEIRLDVDLHLGRHAAVIADLRRLTTVHPFRERLHALLMLALYRDGQQAAAQVAFREVRELLVDELGTEPGPELRHLHQQILIADPHLDLAPRVRDSPVSRPVRSPAVAVGSPETPVPRELPAATTSFTGRDPELTALDAFLASQPASPVPTVLITAIDGTAGVGKTALAVQWAHRNTDLYPDGQLYVNLRGYDSAQPLSATDALAGFLRALGVAGQEIPPGEAERAALFRSRLAGRRMLVVLDNASDVEQVRPLLPGTPGCVAIVTSRDALAGLVARDGAKRLDLDLLALSDAVLLLRALIGSRVDAEPEAAVALAAHCCRLPLALRVAAELAATRPSDPLADLAAELADRQQRLDLLGASGDPRTSVRAVFSWSLRHLDPDTASAFRLVGLSPGLDFDAYAAAALTGTSLKTARLLLDQLTRANLIQRATTGRYAMHDLLRDYARELAAVDETSDAQREALTRLFNYYLHATATAMDALYPAEQHQRPDTPALAALAPRLTEPDRSRAWLAAELACLVAVAGHAASHGWPTHAVQLSSLLFRYLDADGRLSEAVAIHDHARGAARQIGDVSAEAGALTSLAAAELRQGSDQHAARHLEQALALRRQIGDRVGETRTLGNLGILAYFQGRYEQAAANYQLALNLSRDTGNRIGEVTSLTNLAGAQSRLGRFEDAADCLQLALSLSREVGNQDGEAYVLVNLGEVSLRQGLYEQAAPYLQQGLALCLDTGDRVAEAAALSGLGELHLRQGRFEDAARILSQALALSRETGARTAEIDVLNSLGETSLATGDHDQARIHHSVALALAKRAGDTYLQARAHNGIGNAHHTGRNLEQACDHWRQALTIYAGIGAPEANQVRARLTAAQSALGTAVD